MEVEVQRQGTRVLLNTTTVTVPPIEDQADPFSSIYTFRFQVSRQLVVGFEVTLNIIPDINPIPVGEVCESVNLSWVLGVRVVDSGEMPLLV